MLTYNKRLYSLKEFYRFLVDVVRTMPHLKRAKRKGLIDDQIIEKIMLAVTEVNGCRVCSYYHASAALKSGMSEEEVTGMLSGSMSDIKEDESVAILFAQHYADQHGLPDAETWQRVVEVYGNEKALGLLGAIRGIMVGNTYGIGYGTLKERFKRKPVEGSNIFYELGILLSVVVYTPFALVHGLIANLIKRPLIKFK